MPLLGGLIAGLFAGLFQFLATFVSRKTALAAAWIGTFGVLVAGLVAAVSAAVSTISVSTIGFAGAGTGFYIASADVGLTAGAVCILVDGLVAVYRWNVSNLSLLARA